MPQDKYSAVWVSHSSMGDFLRCPRAYYLHNVYKNPSTGRKINIVSGALSLGVSVHNTLENLKNMPVEERLKRDLMKDYEAEWMKVSGKMGGFKDVEEETVAKERGRLMIKRVQEHLGPIARKTVRLKEGHNGMPPNIMLSEEDNIILCGLIDWLEYKEEDDSIRVIDFKTGKNEEDKESLQLLIYMLLLHELQSRKVSGAAYWYLDKDNEPVDLPLPNLEESREKVLNVARKVKQAREAKAYQCPYGGCFTCKPYEAIVNGEAEYLGVGGYGQDTYFLP